MKKVLTLVTLLSIIGSVSAKSGAVASKSQALRLSINSQVAALRSQLKTANLRLQAIDNTCPSKNNMAVGFKFAKGAGTYSCVARPTKFTIKSAHQKLAAQKLDKAAKANSNTARVLTLVKPSSATEAKALEVAKKLVKQSTNMLSQVKSHVAAAASGVQSPIVPINAPSGNGFGAPEPTSSQ